VKSAFRNSGNAVGYSYTGKAPAAGKSITPNIGNAIGYGYAGKASAIVKSAFLNAGNTVGYSVTVFLCLPISTLYYS